MQLRRATFPARFATLLWLLSSSAFAKEPSRVGSAHQKHCIWRLPDGDVDYSLCWALIKAGVKKVMYSPDWGATPAEIPTDIGGE